MKFTILKSIVCFIAVLIFSSCGENFSSNKIDFTEGKGVSNNLVGILNSEGQFKRLDRIDINKFLTKDMPSNSFSTEFQEFNISEKKSVEGGIEYYLTSRSTNNQVSISVKLKKDSKNRLLLSGDTCKCETKGCSESWGCNASGSGSTCSCSSCSSDCKKTSSSGEDPGFE